MNSIYSDGIIEGITNDTVNKTKNDLFSLRTGRGQTKMQFNYQCFIKMYKKMKVRSVGVEAEVDVLILNQLNQFIIKRTR